MGEAGRCPCWVLVDNWLVGRQSFIGWHQKMPRLVAHEQKTALKVEGNGKRKSQACKCTGNEGGTLPTMLRFGGHRPLQDSASITRGSN